MADSPSLSRRQALAAACVATTGVGGYVAGARTGDGISDWSDARDCSPSSLATSTTDWPFSRHDRANTSHAPSRAGPDWPPTTAWESTWSIADIHSIRSLVISDGVAVAILEAMRGAVVGLSLADGRLLWRRPAEDAGHGRALAASGSAFVEASAPDSDASFAARSLGDGAKLWTDSFSSQVPQTLAGGRLLVFERSPDRSRNERHFAITALDARTGVECWRAVHVGWPPDAAVADGRIVVPTDNEGVIALDPTSGERLWRSKAGGDAVAVVDGRVICQQFPGELRAFSLSNGSFEWHVQSDHYLEGGTDEQGAEYARPDFEIGAVTPNAVVYTLDVHSDYPERVQARDPTSGDLLWDVGPEPRPVENHGYSRPIVVGDDVLVIRYARREGKQTRLMRSCVWNSKRVPSALARRSSTTSTFTVPWSLTASWSSRPTND